MVVISDVTIVLRGLDLISRKRSDCELYGQPWLSLKDLGVIRVSAL